MPNRYSKFYYIERTGGVSVNYKGSFADTFCDAVEFGNGRIEGSAGIILKGGKTAELVQYPNFTDTVTDSDGDGLADTEELLKGTAWIDFTLPYELYTGQRLPAGVRALIPVWDYLLTRLRCIRAETAIPISRRYEVIHSGMMSPNQRKMKMKILAQPVRAVLLFQTTNPPW
jgi:hypothetical protein